MTTWALIVFALGQNPRFIDVYKSETECRAIAERLATASEGRNNPRCFVMVENKSLDDE